MHVLKRTPCLNEFFKLTKEYSNSNFHAFEMCALFYFALQVCRLFSQISLQPSINMKTMKLSAPDGHREGEDQNKPDKIQKDIRIR